ncbi:hypothetical protein RB614_37750 [Phytohabitans sp. ZYX-F-186]|uniref:Uncharacterized protein n=1 Tax=Phytohabitans maris TaxID=3071409 RepID=A0ABU0ZV98_9ACTN|nr:hypothetical protein [Phytohabitans sp. ZYX-F-186]MDQ7910254.1 hypothetical protein [Phytohabitans sp. ZYX-F-186]
MQHLSQVVKVLGDALHRIELLERHDRAHAELGLQLDSRCKALGDQMLQMSEDLAAVAGNVQFPGEDAVRDEDKPARPVKKAAAKKAAPEQAGS